MNYIDKMRNHLSRQITEHTNTTAYADGNLGPVF